MLGALFKGKKKQEVVVDEAELMPVRFEVGDKVINLDEVSPRAARRMLEKQRDVFRKKFSKYKDLVDSEGRRVTIVIKSPKILALNITVSLEFPEELQPQIEGSEAAERVA